MMGSLCGLAGIAIGGYVSLTAIGEGYELLPLFAGLAAFLTGAISWWLLLERPAKYTLLRGGLAGTLAGLISHYLCWYLLILFRNICYWGWGGCTSSLGEPPVDPLNGLWGAAVLTLGSLLFFGWLTVPLGAVFGGMLVMRKGKT